MNKALEPKHIIIKAGERHTKPLEVTCVGPESRVNVTLGQGASVVIFDASTSDSHSVRVVLEADSELLYVSLSSGSARTLESTVHAGASMHWHCTTIGNANETHSLISRCVGPQAKSSVDWIFSVKGREKQFVNVRNIFAAKNGGGEITLKGVAGDQAYATCHGMIEITEEGTGTDTYLTEDVLMLDSTAKVDAIPSLEIRTNDVKASHSATVSRVTTEDLFYLQSRGIAIPAARRMFVDGFLFDLTERITEPSIRMRIEAAIASATSPR